MSKPSSEVVQYQYPEITIVSCSKTLSSDLYFQYQIAQNAENRLIINGITFSPKHLYLFHEACVIENHRHEDGIQTSFPPMFFVIPLQSSWFVSKTALDTLFGEASHAPINLQNMISNNQPCTVGDNSVVLSVPISVPFVFPENMARKDAILGVSSQKTRPGIATHSPIIEGNEGLEVAGSLYDRVSKMSRGKFPDDRYSTDESKNNFKCNASDPSGAQIAEIAMVPVDSDVLNGLYVLSLTKMLNDFFLFICAVAFSYFFVVNVYVFFMLSVIDSIKKSNDDNRNDVNNSKKILFYFLNTILIISSLLLCFGLIYQGNYNSSSEYNEIETLVGLLFFIVFGISACFIMIEISYNINKYEFLKSQGILNLSFTENKGPFSNVAINFAIIFACTMIICTVILICFYFVPNDTINAFVPNLSTFFSLLFTICLGSCGIFSTLAALSYIFVERGNAVENTITTNAIQCNKS